MNETNEPRRYVQDLSAAQDPDALLTPSTVKALVGYAPTTLRRWVREGKFPAPKKFGGRLRWRAADVRAWMQARTITPG